MSFEQFDDKEKEHEGEKYLRLLGLGHLADRKIATASGTIQARDFLDICGEHARPILVGFETMSPNDPRYGDTKNALRSFVGQYIEGRQS
ncbi:MAG TPA: hypothetical protein VIK37_01060 [Candidatus Saccharimonadales bacterium]